MPPEEREEEELREEVALEGEEDEELREALLGLLLLRLRETDELDRLGMGRDVDLTDGEEVRMDCDRLGLVRDVTRLEFPELMRPREELLFPERNRLVEDDAEGTLLRSVN